MSLAALKAELDKEKKRKAAELSQIGGGSGNGGNKFMRRGDEEKLLKQKLDEKKKANTVAPVEDTKKDEPKEEPTTETQAEQIPPIPRDQVILRLRQRGQPITLFGETDWVRYQRLHHLEEQEPIEYIEGMDNEFARLVEENDGEGGDKPRAKEEDDVEFSKHQIGDLPTGMESVDRKLSKEDFVFVLLKTMLNEWEQELNDRPDLEKRTAQGKVATATYKQCRKHIKPLFKLLRDKRLPGDILDPVHVICCFMQDREYVKANDMYLQMAIGNAPWPMGVTMVGIHERSAREKIFTNQVAHVLNDETQRKYIQAIKRIMTWCQRRYPNDPSKCVG